MDEVFYHLFHVLTRTFLESCYIHVSSTLVVIRRIPLLTQRTTLYLCTLMSHRHPVRGSCDMEKCIRRSFSSNSVSKHLHYPTLELSSVVPVPKIPNPCVSPVYPLETSVRKRPLVGKSFDPEGVVD